MAVNDGADQESHSNADVPIRFTDWRGGEGITNKKEQVETARLKRRNLRIGNRTEIAYSRESVSAGSGIIKGKPLYQRLDLHNRDCWWWYREDVKTSRAVDNAYKKTLVGAFAYQLELNDYQSHQVFMLLMSLDLPKLGLPAPLSVFVLCALVINQAAESYGDDKLYHPQRSPQNNDPHFQSLEDKLVNAHPRITKKTLSSIYHKLSQGDPPRRKDNEWQGVVRQDPFVTLHPSYVSDHFDSDKN